MSRSLTGVLLKGFGAVVLLLLVLSVIRTIISVVLGFVAAAVSLVITVAVLFVVLLAAFGLVSLFSDDDSSGNADWRVPESRGSARDAKQSKGWRKWLPGKDDDSGGVRADERDPEKRLRERYVAGEINEAEFERKIDLLLRSNDTEKRLNERSLGERGGSNRERDRLRDR